MEVYRLLWSTRAELDFRLAHTIRSVNAIRVALLRNKYELDKRKETDLTDDVLFRSEWINPEVVASDGNSEIN